MTRPIVDLPHPLSPTNPSVSPLEIWKLTSSTACSVPFGTRKYFFRFLTSIKLIVRLPLQIGDIVRNAHPQWGHRSVHRSDNIPRQHHNEERTCIRVVNA